jgi:hypothetical protein
MNQSSRMPFSSWRARGLGILTAALSIRRTAKKNKHWPAARLADYLAFYCGFFVPCCNKAATVAAWLMWRTQKQDDTFSVHAVSRA